MLLKQRKDIFCGENKKKTKTKIKINKNQIRNRNRRKRNNRRRKGKDYRKIRKMQIKVTTREKYLKAMMPYLKALILSVRSILNKSLNNLC